MTAAKIRVGGAWVDSTKVGKVRIGGAWVDFAPAGGPSYEALNWISAPALTNADDGPTAAYHMGCSFTVGVSKPCYGVRWRVPDSLLTPGVGFYATLYQISPNIQHQKLSIAPVAGGDQDFLFAVPTTLLTTEQYSVGVTTIKYSFRSAASVGGFPFVSPSGNVSASTGRLSDPADPDSPPGSSFPSIYYVSPLVGV